MASLKDKANNILSDKSTNLLPENIKKDTTILGVVGTLETLDTSDANANINDIVQDKTAYVNGSKVTGNLFLNTGSENFYYGESGVNIALFDSNGDEEPDCVQISKEMVNRLCYETGATLTLNTKYADLAELICLTADKIKKGETILGITGELAPQTTKFYTGHRVTDISSNFTATFKSGFIYSAEDPDININTPILLYICGVITYDNTGMTDYDTYKNWSISFKDKNDEELFSEVPYELNRDNFYSGFPRDSVVSFVLSVGTYSYWKSQGITNDNLSQITKIVITDTTLS